VEELRENIRLVQRASERERDQHREREDLTKNPPYVRHIIIELPEHCSTFQRPRVTSSIQDEFNRTPLSTRQRELVGQLALVRPQGRVGQ